MIQDPTQTNPQPASQPGPGQSLSTRAMLVKFTCKPWRAQKFDKKASAAIAAANHAPADQGRYTKQLFAKGTADAYTNVTQTTSAIMSEHYRQTLPWLDNGLRILPSANFLHYAEFVRESRPRFEGAVAAFLPVYPTLKEHARNSINGLFNESDYPAPADMPKLFTFDCRFYPLPTGQDFRADIADEAIAEIRQQVETETNNAVSAATLELCQRVHDALTHLVASAKDAGQPGHRFHADAHASKIIALVDVLPRLNLTADPEIDRIRDAIAALAITPAALEAPINRQQIAHQAEKIANDMAAFMGQPA